jgi:hypothetical protein
MIRKTIYLGFHLTLWSTKDRDRVKEDGKRIGVGRKPWGEVMDNLRFSRW